MPRRARLLVLSLLLIASTGGPVRAQIPNPAVHLGAFGGYHVFGGDADLRVGTVGNIESGPDLGVRIGVDFTWLVGAEIVAEEVLAGSTLGGVTHATNFRGLVVFHVLEESHLVMPFAVVGGGLYASFSEDLGDDVDYLLTYGIGVKLMLSEWVIFRLQVDHVIGGDGIDSAVANNFDLTGGFDFVLPLKRKEAPPPPPASDQDGDGLPDRADRCPKEAGSRGLRGCPDMDGDGVSDLDDDCVADKGPPHFNGCPDSDGDGVADRRDRCPKRPGLEALSGCPDADGDGIEDRADKCPDAAGPEEREGCPEPKGPPVELVKRLSGPLRGITFAGGKAVIDPSSLPALDAAVEALKELPELSLIVEGHTDSVGSDARNMALSQARANAVRAYFVEHGVAKERLFAIGYGETQPVADNATKEGRAENRRIELRVVPSGR